MAKNDQEEMFEKIASASLSRNVELLKYAEAKNAAMLTFSSAWVIGIVNIINSKRDIPQELINGAMAALPIFSMPALLSLYSFIPRSKFFPRKKSPEHGNLLYFGDIASNSATDYETALKTRYFPEEGRSTTDLYIRDLTSQIFTYSNIANRKFKIFNISARICLLAVTVLMAFAGRWVWNHAELTAYFAR